MLKSLYKAMKYVREQMSNFNNTISKEVRIYGAQIVTAGALGILHYIFPYSSWFDIGDTTAINMVRTIAAMLCVRLVVGQNIPSIFTKRYNEGEGSQPYNVWYWYCTLTFCLPFVSTYCLFETHFSTFWSICFVSYIFILASMVSLKLFLRTCLIGWASGSLMWYASHFSDSTERFIVSSILIDNAVLFSSIVLTCTSICVLFLKKYQTITTQALQERENCHQLEQFKDEAQKYQQALYDTVEQNNNFFNNLSHEIRSPLQGILSISDVSLREWNTLPDMQKKYYMNMISQSGATLLSLLSNMLDMSKFAAGKMILQLESHKIDEIINNAISQIHSLCYINNIIISVKNKITHQDYEYRTIDDQYEKVILQDRSHADAIVHIDASRIEQVLRNIISNAIKYSIKNNNSNATSNVIEIIIDEHQSINQNSSDKNLVIRVIDNGTGIAQDDLDAIFLPFVQSNSNNNTANTSGLGLHLCKHIIESHNGEIWAENNIQNGKVHGAIFSFTLPMQISDHTAIHSDTDTIDITPVEKNNIAGIEILLIDDDEICEIAARIMLEPEKVNITYARSYEEGVAFLQDETISSKFSVIMLDLMLPNISGTALITAISNISKDIPIIIQSGAGYVSPEDLTIKNVIGYITKPYNKQTVLQAIDKALATQKEQV